MHANSSWAHTNLIVLVEKPVYSWDDCELTVAYKDLKKIPVTDNGLGIK